MNTVGRIEQLSISPSGTRAGLRIDFAESGPITLMVYARENADALYCARGWPPGRDVHVGRAAGPALLARDLCCFLFLRPCPVGGVAFTLGSR